MPRHLSNIIDDVIVMEILRSKPTVVEGRGFPRRQDVVTTTCNNDSEADDENEARWN